VYRMRPGGPLQHCTRFLSSPSIPPGTHSDTPFTRPDGSQFQRMEGLPGGAYVDLPVGDSGAFCAMERGLGPDCETILSVHPQRSPSE
jgi:hypothetical protein